MWTNPKYARPDPPEPPEETGRRLATLPRGNSAELRITLDEYQGNPYVSLRVWEKGRDGNFWPTRKGCTVRVAELTAAVEALERAEDLVAEDDGGKNYPPKGYSPAGQGYHGKWYPPAAHPPRPGQDDRPAFVERRRRPPPREHRREDMPPSRPDDGKFDEFGNG